MIPKGSQRAGGQQLATHLLNAYDNDRVEIAEVRGAVAADLHGAFAEWRAIASATQCRKYLYSLSVNPDPEQRPLTRDEYQEFVDRVENKLGLTGQPRALVFHVKHGREHCHAVWSRIDVERMRAVQLSHDWPQVHAVVKEFARDHELELPTGMTRRRDRPRRRPENLGEKQQEERTGQTRTERMATITAAWRETQTGADFVRALEERGFYLARGDRRSYVVIDRFGEIHSLSKQLEGVRPKQLKERLVDFPSDKLPEPAKAREFAKARRAALTAKFDFLDVAEKERATLAESHRRRRAALDEKWRALQAQHQTERDTLRDAQEALARGVVASRLHSRGRVMAFLARITGIRVLTAMRHRRQDRTREAEHTRQREALQRRHDREGADFQRHFRTLDKLDTRERRSLETALRREQFRLIAGRAHEPVIPPPAPEPPARQILTAEQRAKVEKMRTVGKRITTRPAPSHRDRAPRTLSPPFNEAAAPPAAKPARQTDSLTPEFNAAAAAPESDTRQRQENGKKPESLRQAWKDAQPSPERLEDALKKTAEQKRTRRTRASRAASPPFNEAASPQAPNSAPDADPLTPEFNTAAAPEQADTRQRQENGKKPESLRQAWQDAQPSPDPLDQALKDVAEQKRTTRARAPRKPRDPGPDRGI